MSSRFQSAVLGSPLVYPNAVVWSEENLVAVACGNTVIILNPANTGIRGVITIPSSKPFPVGMIDGGDADLQSGCMLPFHLSRDTRPCVRSISWSPMGLANNASCLLAVCTTAGRVKLYRFPFCEFSVEWVEVLDISEMLYNYFESTGFGEHQIVSSETLDVIPRQDNADHECASDVPVYALRNKRRRQNAVTVAASDPDNVKENDTWQIVPHPARKGKTQEKASEDCNLPLVTVQQYASRNEMLMSLTMAWSPILGTSENGIAVCHNSSSCCSILAVGGKCGRISFWRIQAPEGYSINNTRYPIKALLVGLLKAHDTWITAISWALYGSDVSKPQLLLATGSSDGRVKIWKVNGDELLMSSEVNNDSFALWNEVMTVDPAIISVLSLTVPSQPLSRLLLAIGKASGSFEVWDLDISTNRFGKVGCYNAHDRIVTGLAWAFEGRCLYSCSQDNSMKSWILMGNSLREVPIPSNNPGLKSSSDVPCVFDSCFGLAVSPGNLAIAVARKFDVDLLHPMYEGRTHRAAVEFLWIGGQQLDLSSPCPDIDNKYFPGFPKKELIWWESNIIQTLKYYENPSRPLNIWDIVAALLAFKQSAPEHVEHVLLKWLISYFGSQFGISMTLLSEASKFLPKLSSRQLHLINIISRRVVLKECKADNISSKQQELEVIGCTKEEQVNLWMELLRRSENELLERLVGITFSAVLSCLSNSSMNSFKAGCWSPGGLRQMEQWVSQNEENIKDHSRSLAAEVRKVEKRRLEDLFQYEVDEQCNFCSAVVPFESTDYAICSGVNSDNGVSQRHKLDRCAVTLQIPPIKPSWYCMCCQRWATKLSPSILFRMPEYPSDFMTMLESCADKDSSMPCCPFCGILLQRSQPEHSLSPSPV